MGEKSLVPVLPQMPEPAAVGQMPLHVQLFDADHRLLDEIRR